MTDNQASSSTEHLIRIPLLQPRLSAFTLSATPVLTTSNLSKARRVMARPRGLTFTWWWRCGLCLWHKPTELAHFLLFCSCACFCLYGSFNCISFHKFSRQLPAFSLCSSGLISALLVLSTSQFCTQVIKSQFSKIYQISPDTNSHKTKHTLTNTKNVSKN